VAVGFSGDSWFFRWQLVFQVAVGWQLAGSWLAVGWQLAGWQLAGWQLAGSWLRSSFVPLQGCGRPPQLRVAATAADQAYLDTSTVPCSGCGAPIEKNGGCDKLHCTRPRCGAFTCWGCGAGLDPRRPYAHFEATRGAYRCPGRPRFGGPQPRQPAVVAV
jgi:hypothetical protein